MNTEVKHTGTQNSLTHPLAHTYSPTQTYNQQLGLISEKLPANSLDSSLSVAATLFSFGGGSAADKRKKLGVWPHVHTYSLALFG